jgi:acyl carrier protein
MDRADVVDRVNAVLGDEFELAPERLRADATLYEDLEFDSLDAVDLIAALERQFAMKIDRQNAEKEIRDIRTLSDVYDFVQRRLAAPGGGSDQ